MVQVQVLVEGPAETGRATKALNLNDRTVKKIDK